MRINSPRRFVPRRDAGLYGYERVLERGGFGPVVGVDEAGRGACAGPLVIGAAVLPRGRRGRIDGLTDSKLLTPRRREEVYAEIVARATAWSALVIPSHDIDRIGLHRCNIAGMRRVLGMLDMRPGYVLTDGFRVPGIGAPTLAVPKGDQVAACIAAASVVAKVTRDRLMGELHERYPRYGFVDHKGYVTRVHAAALAAFGPCPEHRFSFVNVAGVATAPERFADAKMAPATANGGAPDTKVVGAGTGPGVVGGETAELVAAELLDASAAESGGSGDLEDSVLASGEGSRT